MRKLICIAAALALLTSAASAHPGRTDANGGHWNNSTGEYHYHHGYPAHQHPNGVCPYEPDSQSDDAPAPTYNDGLGDDGTYETAWNLGYQHGMEYLCELNADIPIDLSALSSELCNTRRKSGATPYADMQSSYDDAYEAGYYQSEEDLYSELNKAILFYANSQSDLQAKYDEGYAAGLEDGYNEARESVLGESAQPTESEQREAREQQAAANHPYIYLFLLSLPIIGGLVSHFRKR